MQTHNTIHEMYIMRDIITYQNTKQPEATVMNVNWI